jgi:type II secretory pathway pseudopilin PulG
MKKPVVVFAYLLSMIHTRFFRRLPNQKKYMLKSAQTSNCMHPKNHFFATHHFNHFHQPKLGLTLIEALVAIAIFSIGLLGMIKLMSVSSRLQNNMEYQLQANMIASNIREILIAPAGRNQPAFIEGILDNKQCSGVICDRGYNARQGINLQNQNLYSGAALTVRVRHGVISGNTLTFTNNCHDPIFAQITFQTRGLQTTTAGQNNGAAVSKTVRYNHQVGQYRLLNNNPAAWGLSCAI